MPKKQHESDMGNPREFAAWAFAAGIPDPRGPEYGHQPLIPAPCFPGLSEMLWEMGFRHHADLQTRWVQDYSGGERNFVALGLVDSDPQELIAQATELVVDQFPEVADRLARLSPETRDAVVKEQAQAILSNLEQLRAAQAELDTMRGGQQP